MKFWVNLFDEWDDPQLGLGNAGFNGDKVIDFVVDGNAFGEFTDPYLTKLGKENPHKLVLTPSGKVVKEEPVNNQRIHIPIEFATKSHYMDFYGVPEIGLTKSKKLTDYCPKDCPKDTDTCEKKAPTTSTPASVAAPTPCEQKPNEVTAVGPVQANQDALKMTYEVAKKMIGLALVLV